MAANLSLLTGEIDGQTGLVPITQIGPPGATVAVRADRILVKPGPGTALTDLDAFHAQTGCLVRSVFPAIGNLEVLQAPAGASVTNLVATYLQSGLVAYAEPDAIMTALLVPNDFHYANGDLWNLNNYGQYGGTPGADIHAPAAWDLQHGAPDIIVAVIDTGALLTHEDLAANLWVNPGENGSDFLGFPKCCNGRDDDGDGYVDDVHGINAILGTGVPLDDYGHGTHVSGIIGAVGNNGVGIVGVAWSVQLMECKFLDATGNGSISDAITCIHYAVAKGARIINASWGSFTFTSNGLYDAINMARSAGVIFVAACGNSQANNDVTPLYPASYNLDNIIAVAATDRTDALAPFSDYGPKSVDLAAPGDPVFSCWNTSDSAYQYYAGTSMAAPHVVGACALVWEHFALLNYQQVIHRVLATTDPLPSLAGKCVTGGRLDLSRALSALGQLSVSPTGGWSASGPAGGPFSPASRNYTIQNSGFGPLSWSVTANQSWLSCSPANGSLDPGQNASVVVTINAQANSLSPGTYSATIAFTDLESPSDVATRQVTLTVLSGGGGPIGLPPTTL